MSWGNFQYHEKLKPLSLDQYTISDIISFSEDLRNTSLNESDILVFYDVSSLFTNVSLDETIHILVEKAFRNNWFNVTHKLNISKSDLVEFCEWQQNVGCLSLMEGYTNRLMVLQWVHP